MINRVLIRIKVVQLLYSYLLTKSEFKIETAPESPTRDKRYAYAMYLDTLMFLLRLGGVKLPGAPEAAFPADSPLSRSGLIRALAAEDRIRDLMAKGAQRVAAYAGCEADVYKAVMDSSVMRSFKRKKSTSVSDDMPLWTTIIREILANNAGFLEGARLDPDFTYSGFQRGLEMAAETFESYSDNKANLAEARNALRLSLDKANELYHALLLLPGELTRVQDLKLDAARHKYLPTDEDLNPNTRFVDNVLPKLIDGSPDMEEYLKKHPISWVDDTALINSLLNSVLASQTYADYMAAPTTDREADCEFWRSVLKNIILPGDDLAEALENKSVYWNDDLDTMGTFMLKTVKRIGSGKGDTVELLPDYKDEEDARFGSELFGYAVDNLGDYRALIDKFVNSGSWDTERLAFMDQVIMLAAVAEIVNYPAIPLAVTLNEYIEIANSYSTPKSGQFINGVLYSVINELKANGVINKQ